MVSDEPMWRSLSGKPVQDLIEAVRSLLHTDDHLVHVGTDSQRFGYRTEFVTAVAIVYPGHGGRVFYRRHEGGSEAKSLAHRLFREAELSLGAAQRLSDSVLNDIIVHVDVNEDLKHRSAKYVRALAGMVVGHGFQVRVKPDAWCATHLADSLVKRRNGHLASA